MSYGKIQTIEQDAGTKTYSGTLKDLDTGDSYPFKGQSGLDQVTTGDICDYTLSGGSAEKLVPNLQVNDGKMNTYSAETRKSINLTILLAAKDTSDVDVMIKKF